MIEQHSDRIALKDGLGKSLTYAAMGDQVHTIAAALQKANVKPADRVAVFQHPSVGWVCSMLAILRIGATHVPLDLRNPAERLKSIVENCQPTAILCHNETSEDAIALGVPDAKRIDISTLSPSSERIRNVAEPNQPAIILHTSGSTGVPKGIVLSHANIRSNLEFSGKISELGTEVVLQQTALSFDLAVEQVFTAIANGGRLFVVSRSQRGDPITFVELMAKEEVTYTLATTSEYLSMFRFASHDLMLKSSWRTALTVGELTTHSFKRHFQKLNKPELRLFAGYGASETSISSHKHELLYQNEQEYPDSEETPIPVGRSLPNYSTYILDEHLQPVPIGVPGEIVIGGAGVSQGYLNNAKLTQQTFILDPFASAEAIRKLNSTSPKDS